MSRRALQWYYTSCEQGVGGHAGFQTRATSEGLQLEDRRELEALASYVAPHTAEREPDAAKVAALPVCFRAIQLQSGRHAVIRSCYVGQDYSGRWGNYFAHALVFEEPLPSLWPVDLTSWPGWRSSISREEGATEPSALPEVGLEELAPPPALDLEALGALITSDERARTYRSMLDALHRRDTDSRSLVIRVSTPDDALLWIALLQKSLATVHQGVVGFSSYQVDPRSCLAINGVSGDSDFRFDETERKYQFYVFDFVDGANSAVAEHSSDYLDAVTGWMRSAPDKLARLHAFALGFSNAGLDGGLDLLVRLFQVRDGDRLDLTPSGLRDLVAFSLAHATADGIEAAIEAVDAAVGQGPERSMPALRAIGIDFLVDAAKQTERPDLLRRAHEAWVSAFVDELARGGAADQVLELVPKLEVDLLGEALLRPSSMEELSRLAPALPAAALQTAAHTLHEFERPAAGELGSSKTLAFVDAAVSGRDEALADYSWVMSLSDAPAELEAVTLRLAATVGGSARARRPDGGSGDDELVAVGEALAGATVRLSAQRRWGLLRSLIAAGGTDPILVGEVRRSLRDSDDVAEDYRGYEAALLTDESAFARRQSAPVARIAWNEADPEARATLTRRWLKVGRCELLGEDLARLVFTVADEAVRLGPRDPASTELARSLLETVAGRGDGTAAVRRAHLRTDLDAALARDSDGLERLGRSLNDASQALGAELLAGALGPLLVQAASPEQYGRVVEHLRGRGRDLGSAYARVIESLPKREVDSLEVLALAYWLGAQASEGASDPLRRRLLDLHAQRVGDAGSSRQTNLRDVVSALPPFQGDRVRFLDDFMDQARKLKTPWWKSLLGGRR